MSDWQCGDQRPHDAHKVHRGPWGVWTCNGNGVDDGEKLSTPVPVSEGPQVSGEVGPASGVVAGSNQIAATGAGNGPGGVVPVPVAAQPHECDPIECACELTPQDAPGHPSHARIPAAFELALLRQANAEESLDVAEDELLDHHRTEGYRRAIQAAYAAGYAVGLGYEVTVGDLGDRVLIGDRMEPRWGSGPLVDHNLETPAPATCDTCDGKGVIACYGSYSGGPTACIDCHGTGEMPCPDCPGTGSADPDGLRYPRFSPDAVLVVDAHSGPEQWAGERWNDYVAAAERSQSMVTVRILEVDEGAQAPGTGSADPDGGQ